MKLKKFIGTCINFSSDFNGIYVYTVSHDGDLMVLGKFETFEKLKKSLDITCKIIRWRVKNNIMEIWID